MKEIKVLKVCMDFDGVFHDYRCQSKFNNWKTIEGPPVRGIPQFVKEIFEAGYTIDICTPRCSHEGGKEAIKEWLDRYNLSYYINDVTNIKPLADVYIDDRSICFTGTVKGLRDQIENFHSWQYRGEENAEAHTEVHN